MGRSLAGKKRYKAKLKERLFQALGRVCACCGEKEPVFLALDHIGGGGNAHRAKVGEGRALWLAVLKEGCPKDKYRILCMNCNHATRFMRECPHQLRRDGRVVEGSALEKHRGRNLTASSNLALSATLGT